MAAVDTIRDDTVRTPTGAVDVEVNEHREHTALIELTFEGSAWTVALNAGQTKVLEGEDETPPMWVEEALYRMGLGLKDE